MRRQIASVIFGTIALGFATGAAQALPAPKALESGVSSGAALEQVDWRSYRHCHYDYYGYRRCHGGNYYNRPYYYGDSYYRPYYYGDYYRPYYYRPYYYSYGYYPYYRYHRW